jgi:hypothetical protein
VKCIPNEDVGNEEKLPAKKVYVSTKFLALIRRTIMKLPLELKEEFGNYAFPDEDYGAKAIEPILPFLETIADVDDSEYRQIPIGYNKEGTVVAKTQKLSNIRLNLNKAMSPQEIVEVMPTIMSTIWTTLNPEPAR